MPRSRFCRVCKDFHDVEAPWPAECLGHFASRSAGAGEARFHIISDTIEPFQAMHTGEVFSSKSRYRQDLKARGYIEVGNENRTAKPPPPVDRASIRKSIRDSYQQLGG